MKKQKELKNEKYALLNPSGLDENNGTYNISSAKDSTI